VHQGEATRRKLRRRVLFALSLLAVFALGAPASAQAPGTKEIADRLAKDYGVTVLKTADGEIDGKPVLFVTVMNEGGNENDAFQVTTLAVDPATGELISQYRTTTNGQVDAAAGLRSPSVGESGEVIREWSLRPIGR
jgi:hypothetical protein